MAAAGLLGPELVSTKISLNLRQFFAIFSCSNHLNLPTFSTNYVATVVFGGRADAVPGSFENLRFDEGVRMGSWGLLLHSITGERHSHSIVNILHFMTLLML